MARRGLERVESALDRPLHLGRAALDSADELDLHTIDL
jgi:hypothetical protein